MDERWLPVAGYEGHYAVSDQGRVRNERTGRILKPWIRSPGGYPCVALQVRMARRYLLVHRLVARAFLGPCPLGHQCNHKDGNKAHAAASNLEYVTPSENLLHAYRLGLREARRIVGTALPWTKLTDTQVREIRQSSEKQKVLAARYGVSQTNISSIRRGATWAHVN